MTKKKRTVKKHKKTAISPLFTRIRLKQIRLRHSETKLSIKGGTFPKKMGINVAMGFGASDREKLLKGDVTCAIDSFYEDEAKPSVFIHCQFQLLYAVEGDKMPSKSELKAVENSILSMVAFQAWPYIREFVHSSSLRMGMPAITLNNLLMGENPDGTLSVSVQGQTEQIPEKSRMSTPVD